MLARKAAMTGSSPVEIGIPMRSPFGSASLAGGGPVRGSAGSMIRPGTGGSAGSGEIGMAPAMDGGMAAGAASPNRTVVRRSALPDRRGGPDQAPVGRAATSRFGAGRDERVIGQGGRPPRDRVMRDRDADLSRRRRPSTDQLDQRCTRDRPEDQAEGQETELARRHAARI